jgi:hypothetical protein
MLIVTGMHRSGTSFVANLLKNMGGDFGDESLLMEKDRWNQRGYYENWELVDANNRLILGRAFAAAYRRIAVADLRADIRSLLLGLFNVPAFVLPGVGMIGSRAAANGPLMRVLGERYDACVVKDVRFCITIEVWRRMTGIRRVLFCYRHPHEVALSLKKRQHIPLGKGLALWTFHVTEFLRQARGLPVTLVDFNRFFSPETAGAEVRRLYAFLDRTCTEDEMARLMSETLDRGLRHNIGDNAELPPKVDKLYRQLCGMHDQSATATPLRTGPELSSQTG